MRKPQAGRSMYTKELKIVELREKALSARDKAGQARRMVARIAETSEARVFEQHATEFDAKAAILDREIAELEERDPNTIGSTPMRLEQSGTAEAAHRWRMKAEE